MLGSMSICNSRYCFTNYIRLNMINFFLRQIFYYRIKHNLIPEEEPLHYKDTTFNSFNNPEYIKEILPWGWIPPAKNIRTTYSVVKQRFGKFYCRAKLDPEKGCFWLLNISNGQYNEIDHIEFFDDRMKLTSWYGKFGGQWFFEPIEKIYSLYEGYKKSCCKIKAISFCSKFARNWVLNDVHTYTIIWKWGFILWKIDGIPIGLNLEFWTIPKQHMYMILTNFLNFYSFKSGI